MNSIQPIAASRRDGEPGSIPWLERRLAATEIRAQFPGWSGVSPRPCPCGHSGDKKQDYRCSGEQIERYAHRVSGPLLDLIDLHVEVARPEHSVLDRSGPEPEASSEVAARVSAAREIQLK